MFLFAVAEPNTDTHPDCYVCQNTFPIEEMKVVRLGDDEYIFCNDCVVRGMFGRR